MRTPLIHRPHRLHKSQTLNVIKWIVDDIVSWVSSVSSHLDLRTRLGILAKDKAIHSPMTILRIPWAMIDWSTKIHVRIGFLARMVSIVLFWRGCVKIRDERREEGQGKKAKKFRVRQRSELHLWTSRQLSNFSPWSSSIACPLHTIEKWFNIDVVHTRNGVT